MTATAQRKSRSKPDLWIGRVFACLSLCLIVVALADYARDVPDSYHNEKARSLLIAVALFLQSVSGEFSDRNPHVFWALLGASCVSVLAVFWLTFR